MLHLRVVSPEEAVFDGEVESVLMSGILGSSEVLTGHAPITLSLEERVMEYKTHQRKQKIGILDGSVQVERNDISLCVGV